MMEAHDPLSARIAASAGFQSIWASGLAIATSLGYRDCSEMTFTETATVVERMADVTDLPILVDGDSGWGNFNNARLAAKRLARAGVAGVCIEDKLFPKMNSFVGEAQPLADTNEFCGKIAAVVDATSDTEFVTIARVEALVSDQSMDVALDRAERYVDAGATAILIHSKQKDGVEILDFARQWRGRKPLIVVPTTYAAVGMDALDKVGISLAIWANHSLRAGIRAMTDVCDALRSGVSPIDMDHRLASLEEIFEMFDYDELSQAEARFLPLHRA